MRRASFALLVPLLLLPRAAAWAQSPPLDPAAQAQAEALFSEGSALLEAGKVAEACPKLEAAVEITRGEALGGKLMLARCYERAGRVASAWGLYSEVGARAEKAGQTSRAEEAKASADALAPRLHYVSLSFAGDPSSEPSLEVVLAGRSLARAAWSTPLPVDPGELAIVVKADQKRPHEQKLTIPEQAGTTKIEIPVLEAAPVVTTPPAARVEPPSGGFWSGQRIAGLVIGLGGVAAAGVGGALGLVAASQYDDGLLEGGCSGSPPVCDDVAPVNDARALGDVATGVFFGGAGLIAVGLVVLLTGSDAEPPPATPALSVGPGQAFVSITVRYD